MKKHSYRAVEAFRGADKTIRIVGHRGARGVFPENTMIGFKSTIEMGINLLEFDVVLCADGVPVITHNHALHVPTFKHVGGDFIDHEPKVLDLTWSQLQCFEVGRLDSSTQYGQRFPDQLQFAGIKKLPNLLQPTTTQTSYVYPRGLFQKKNKEISSKLSLMLNFMEEDIK